ncbi:MAG: hypothetical protein M1337_04435 [Actinobacteria bacterium]|nr:hypothetical protein [Actinomycetota bacterium]
MTEPRDPSHDVVGELKALGENLRLVLQAAWASDERKKLQGEVEAGLSDLVSALQSAGTEFAQSPAGQRLKAEAQSLQARVRDSRAEERVRDELLAALRKANAELKKAAGKERPGNQGL